MSLQDQLSEDLKTAMKAKERIVVETLRMVRAQIKDTQIAKGGELDDEAVIGVLTNAAKKRKEAIELYEKGGRTDLLEKEQQELAVISKYLPEQMSIEEVEKIVDSVIDEIGAQSVQDLGKVMGVAMKQLKGKADGKQIQDVVRQKLSAS